MNKKIGILFGKERSFPEAIIKRINEKKAKGIIAEPVKIDKVMQGEGSGYAVILDRISQDVPFYRAFLKNASISGTYMKPFAGGGWKHVYRLESKEDFFEKHAETGQLVMLLQEEIVFEQYFRCYCIGRKYVHIMPYEPRNPHHLRYVANFKPSKSLLKEMEQIVLKINNYLGYEFNTVELAVRDGVPYAIDFCNPAPDADLQSVGTENFEWVIEHAAKYLIEVAESNDPKVGNLSWGNFIKNSVLGKPL